MEDFVTVKKHHRRKHNKYAKDRSFQTRLFDIQSELMLTPFYQDTIDKLRSAVKEISSKCRLSNIELKDGSLPSIDLICYGLGNFTESYIARYQLALLMALRADIQTDGDVCEVFDPIFTDEEKDFLQHQHLKISEENKEGKHICREDRVTVFYMPHCGKALYNNVLWKNWGRETLQQVVIIGNSFTEMIDSSPSRILRKTASYVMRICPYIQHRELECPSDLESIFNDTSIHTFNTQDVPGELWENVEEPVYDSDDAEIILAPNVS